MGGSGKAAEGRMGISQSSIVTEVSSNTLDVKNGRCCEKMEDNSCALNGDDDVDGGGVAFRILFLK